MSDRHTQLVAQWRQRRLNRLECEHRAFALALEYAQQHGHTHNTIGLGLQVDDKLRRIGQQLQLIKDNAP